MCDVLVPKLHKVFLLSPISMYSDAMVASYFYLPTFFVPFIRKVLVPSVLMFVETFWESVSVGADRILYGLLDKSVVSGTTFTGLMPMDYNLPDELKNMTTAELLWNQIQETIKNY